jgi:hypothetical protein
VADTGALLQALFKAEAAGDTESATHIAAIIHANNDTTPAPTVVPAPAPNTSGGQPGTFEGHPSALSSGADTLQVGPLDTHIPLPPKMADELAGVGSAFHDIAQGIGQKIGLSSSQDVRDTRNTNRELMQDPAGRTGNIMGNAAAMAPVAMLPGGASLAGGAVVGGLLGSLQPSESLGEQALNTGAGMAAAPVVHALPEAGRLVARIPGVRPTLNLASDLLPGGSQRAASRLATQFAGGPDQADAARLAIEQAGKSGALAGRYGIYPTSAQVANNPGLAQMDRTLRNNGAFTTRFGESDDANREAIDNILTGISGTPVQRLRAATARDFQARTMYDDALNNPEHFVQPPTPDMPSFANEAAAKKGLTQDGTPPVNNPNEPAAGLNDIGTRLQDLLQRPAMQDAMTNASRIAGNFGKTIDNRNLIQQLHYAKMHLDDQIGAAQASGKTNDFRSLLDTKNALLGVMDDLSPAYAQARKNFQTASKPMSRMDVGEALRQKYSPGLGDMGSTSRNPATFVNALRDGDDLAASATGFGGATLANTLHPEDIEQLGAAARQLGRQGYAQNAGRAVGSNTGQNLENQRAIQSVGNLNGLMPEGGGAHAATVAGMINHPALIPLGFLGGVRNRGAQGILANAALDPEEMGKLLTPKESLISRYLPSGITAPSVAGGVAATQQPEGHADGGSVKKFTFWDLAQQALHELTSPSTPEPPQPANDGTRASGTKGADFDRYVQAGVNSQS